MTQYSCRSCRQWYDKKLGGCPECEIEFPRVENSLYTWKLNNTLYEQARATTPEAQKETYYREIKKDLDRLVREY
jgi:predicted ATP-dependent serine protease